MDNKFINIKDAAKMLGVSPLTLRNWDKNGKLKAGRHPMNNYRVYLREDIEKIISQIGSREKPLHLPKKEVAEQKFYRAKVIHISN